MKSAPIGRGRLTASPANGYDRDAVPSGSRSASDASASATRSSTGNRPDGFAGLCMTPTTTSPNSSGSLGDHVDVTEMERVETPGYSTAGTERSSVSVHRLEEGHPVSAVALSSG